MMLVKNHVLNFLSQELLKNILALLEEGISSAFNNVEGIVIPNLVLAI